MEKIIDYKLNKDHYEADAWIACCFDDRFSKANDAIIKQRGFAHSDVTEFAGGALSLASPDPAKQEILIDQLRTSIKLHGTKKAVLAVHMDCGANGGSTHFQNNREQEIADLKSKLDAAERSVKNAFPEITIEKLIQDFDGIYKV